MNNKKILFLCVLISSLIMLNGCSVTKNTASIASTENIIKMQISNIANVTKIEIKAYPGRLKIAQSKKEITEIINYINSLDLKKATKTRVSGMGYVITVYFKDNTSKKYEHIGNIYFVDSEKKWYKMTYKQAEKFEGIYNSLGEK